jgi:hypothetical protein
MSYNDILTIHDATKSCKSNITLHEQVTTNCTDYSSEIACYLGKVERAR